MRFQLLAYLLLMLIACGQAKEKIYKPLVNYDVDSGKKIETNSNSVEDFPAFDKAHVNAKRVMVEKFYFSADDASSPFGNPDGAGTYHAFKDWRKTHKDDKPGAFLSRHLDRLTYPKFDLTTTDFEKLQPYLMQRELGSRFIFGIDAAIISIAFGQLYLEGTIDYDFNQTAKTAIKRELIPELLDYWGEPYLTERKLKLNKMMVALNNVK